MFLASFIWNILPIISVCQGATVAGSSADPVQFLLKVHRPPKYVLVKWAISSIYQWYEINQSR